MKEGSQRGKVYALGDQFGEYVRVGVTRKSCDFSPQQRLTVLRSYVNKFNP